MASAKLIAMADQLAAANEKLHEIQGSVRLFGYHGIAGALQAERTEITEVVGALRRLAEEA